MDEGARWEDSGQIGCYYGSQKHHVQLKVLSEKFLDVLNKYTCSHRINIDLVISDTTGLVGIDDPKIFDWSLFLVDFFNI